MPKFDDEFERPHLTLELFDETMLALACVHAPMVVIWVMKEYGVDESWHVIFFILYTQGPMWPLALSKDGEVEHGEPTMGKSRVDNLEIGSNSNADLDSPSAHKLQPDPMTL
ncbi:F-box protein [Striga asiatica]|uniref:F-box protein n=1 Tax=Striga asiatica TaxID=4170 RepID=A0A5A7PTL3_STRAF|nr:F-box protein [Striga asiatica]